MKPPAMLRALVARDGPRLALSITFSFLLHVLLLLSVPVPAAHVDYLLEQAAPPVLSVHIEPPDPPAAAGGSPPVRIELRKPPTPVQEARTETPAEAVGKAPSLPVPEQSAPQPATYAGVNAATTLYLGPLPPRVIEFEGGAEYLRESQLDEPPAVVSIAVPEYPPAAAGEKIGGTVLVAIFIDEEGHVVRTAVVQSSEHVFRFSRGIAEAMANSVFTPGKRDGKAAKSLVFQLVHLDPAIPAPGP